MNDKSLKECVDSLLESNLISLVQDGHIYCDSCKVAKAGFQVHFRSGPLSFCGHHLRKNLRPILNQIEQDAAKTLRELLPEDEYLQVMDNGGRSDV
jgi:hypothetical protein